jgi:hypothetical protein
LVPTFDSAARSQALARPVVLYTITTLGSVFRHTTRALDVVFGGHTFTALTIAHDDEQITQDPSGDELVIHLPITHPLVQRFAATGIPEQSVQVLVQELQSTASEAALSWSGPGQSLSISGHIAALRVPSATADALRIQIPVAATQKLCNHVLFDGGLHGGCAPNPGGDWPASTGNSDGGPIAFLFRNVVTVSSISSDGLTITLVSDGGLADGYFQFGKARALFAADAEPEDQIRSIMSHVGDVITVDLPFVATTAELAASFFQLEAGCDHTMTTCIAKFSNRANFGGHPYMNSAINPWVPSGLGVIQQA